MPISKKKHLTWRAQRKANHLNQEGQVLVQVQHISQDAPLPHVSSISQDAFPPFSHGALPPRQDQKGGLPHVRRRRRTALQPWLDRRLRMGLGIGVARVAPPVFGTRPVRTRTVPRFLGLMA